MFGPNSGPGASIWKLKPNSGPGGLCLGGLFSEKPGTVFPLMETRGFYCFVGSDVRLLFVGGDNVVGDLLFQACFGVPYRLKNGRKTTKRALICHFYGVFMHIVPYFNVIYM